MQLPLFFPLRKLGFFLTTLLIGCLVFALTPALLDDNYANQGTPSVEDRMGVDPYENAVPLPEVWSPPPLNLADVRSKGCVADGLLSEYNHPETDIPLAQSSACLYFHRALETWLDPPDFSDALEVIEKIDRDDVQYGMFIAEAIDVKTNYLYRAQGRNFEFSDMCRKQSRNFWGEHTCKPSLKKSEYQAYLKQITRDAMDIGIRVFLFGQIHYQEESIHFPKVDNVMREMRTYADEQGYDILIGAQTGEITNRRYIAFFDFIEGGVGLSSAGTLEDGPCFSRYWSKPGDWCWPLMWHSRFKDRAQNVFVYLDWNGQVGDDMHTFASLSETERHRALRAIHSRMDSENVSFFPPLITPLPKDGDGNCTGPKQKFYSPSMEHGCKDYDVIDVLLQ